jgi:hypothetical protein
MGPSPTVLFCTCAKVFLLAFVSVMTLLFIEYLTNIFTNMHMYNSCSHYAPCGIVLILKVSKFEEKEKTAAAVRPSR